MAQIYAIQIIPLKDTQDRFGRTIARCTLILTRPSKKMLKKTDISKIYWNLSICFGFLEN